MTAFMGAVLVIGWIAALISVIAAKTVDEIVTRALIAFAYAGLMFLWPQ